MNKTYRLLTSVICVGLFLITSNAIAQEEINNSLDFASDWSNAQKEVFTSKLAPFPENTQIAVAIIEGGATKYIGIKKENDQFVLSNNSNKVFEIGSITKVFTSTLFAQAIKKGDVEPQTNLDEILGYPLRDDKKITLVQLSNHTSGLAMMPMNIMFAQQKDPDNPYIHYKQPQLKDWITKYMSTETKEVKSVYSNLGAALLGHALTLKYNKSYQDLLKENIFLPLGMKTSTTNLTDIEDNLVKGLNPGGTEAANWTFDVLEAAGAIFSTVEDLELFAKAVMDGKDEALNLQRESTFVINENFEMGMGWHIFNRDDKKLYWHNGGTGGYTSSMLIDVENNKAVILLSNISAFHGDMGNVDQIVFELMKTVNN